MSQSGKKKSTYEKRKEARYNPYIDGVKNEYGEEVIRPLTQQEKEILEKFNQEFVDASFTDNNLHDCLIEENKNKLRNLRRRLKKAKDKIAKLRLTGYTNSSGEERVRIKNGKIERDSELNRWIKRYYDISNEIYNLDIKYQIHRSNNMRSLDVMNFKNKISYLEDLKLDQSYLNEFIDQSSDE